MDTVTIILSPLAGLPQWVVLLMFTHCCRWLEIKRTGRGWARRLLSTCGGEA